MLPRRTSFQPGVGRSIPSDLLRAMPGHWQLRELAGAYVNGNGRCVKVSSEPARGKGMVSVSVTRRETRADHRVACAAVGTGEITEEGPRSRVVLSRPIEHR